MNDMNSVYSDWARQKPGSNTGWKYSLIYEPLFFNTDLLKTPNQL